MQRFSPAHAASLLGVHPATLRTWLRSAGFNLVNDPLDHRRRYLTISQLSALAKEHERAIIMLAPGDDDRLASLRALLQQVAARLDAVEKEHKELWSRLLLDVEI